MKMISKQTQQFAKLIGFLVCAILLFSFIRIQQNSPEANHVNLYRKFLPVLISFSSSEVPDSVSQFCNDLFRLKDIELINREQAVQMTNDEQRRVLSTIQFNNPNETGQSAANRVLRSENPVYNSISFRIKTKVVEGTFFIDSLRWQSVPMPISQSRMGKKAAYFKATEISSMQWKQVFRELVDTIIASKQLY